MIKLYYGNGECTIENGIDSMSIMITYSGAIEIDDLTPDGYAITAKNDKIIIFPYQGTQLILSTLFKYIGTFKIVSAQAYGFDGEVSVRVQSVMDYSELINTTAENMTTVSEDLKAGHTYVKKVAKTTLKQTIIPNLHTSDQTLFYLPDNTLYSGPYHVHILDQTIMTGGTHTKASRLLKYNVLEKNSRNRRVGGSSFTASPASRVKHKIYGGSSKSNGDY